MAPFLFLFSIFCFTEESYEKYLERNIDRIKIENYFLENMHKKIMPLFLFLLFIVMTVIIYCMKQRWNIPF